jgi:hypothetical protein
MILRVIKKFTILLFLLTSSLHSKAQDLKPYIDILLSQWRLTDTINDTTLFYRDTLILTRKYSYKVAHNASFLFTLGGSLQTYFACHTYPSEPDKEYCTTVWGQWELIDPKNLNLFYTDMAIYNSYEILNFSDESMILVKKK